MLGGDIRLEAVVTREFTLISPSKEKNPQDRMIPSCSTSIKQVVLEICGNISFFA
jgi:hypothetical protein